MIIAKGSERCWSQRIRHQLLNVGSNTWRGNTGLCVFGVKKVINIPASSIPRGRA